MWRTAFVSAAIQTCYICGSLYLRLLKNSHTFTCRPEGDPPPPHSDHAMDTSNAAVFHRLLCSHLPILHRDLLIKYLIMPDISLKSSVFVCALRLDRQVFGWPKWWSAGWIDSPLLRNAGRRSAAGSRGMLWQPPTPSQLFHFSHLVQSSFLTVIHTLFPLLFFPLSPIFCCASLSLT